MLYNGDDTLDPVALCVVLQIKASPRHCDAFKSLKAREWVGMFSLLSFSVVALLSKSRNMISRSCTAIVFADSWMNAEFLQEWRLYIYFRAPPSSWPDLAEAW